MDKKDKKKINDYQKKLYHKNKNNPNSSCYLPYRLKLQREAYAKKKNGNVKYYSKRQSKDIKFNFGEYIISFG